MERVTIRKPDDFHLHLRDGLLLMAVLLHTLRHFRRALIMPNLEDPITTGEKVRRYREQIEKVRFEWYRDYAFTPLMTIQITEDTTPQMIDNAVAAGAIAGKVYFRGTTNNSQHGVRLRKLKDLYPTFRRMAERGMMSCWHYEVPFNRTSIRDFACGNIDKFLQPRQTRNVVTVHNAEERCIPYMRQIVRDIPDLRIVAEHVTSAAMINAIMDLPDHVAMTLTAHHGFLTFHDVVAAKMHPHNFCKPAAKTETDRQAILEAMTSGSPKVFAGTDSAPHWKGRKESSDCCAGCYTAPHAVALYATVFDYMGRMDRLEAFLSLNGARHYGLEPNTESITLERQEWRVPTEYHCYTNPSHWLVPFAAGATLPWRVVND